LANASGWLDQKKPRSQPEPFCLQAEIVSILIGHDWASLPPLRANVLTALPLYRTRPRQFVLC
jgi:hypothetical protein